MGTDPNEMYGDMTVVTYKKRVKLNDPLMGTETLTMQWNQILQNIIRLN